MKEVLIIAAAILLVGLAGCSWTADDAVTTTSCDPSAADADRQVVEAFLVAYKTEDVDGLKELAPVDEIWDLAGVPLLGKPQWTGVVAWAEKGWEVEDRLELVEFVSYGPDAGSDIVVRRTNRVLLEAEVEWFDFSLEVPSEGCSIERLIGGIGSIGQAVGRCEFYDAFADSVLLVAPTFTVPAECT